MGEWKDNGETEKVHVTYFSPAFEERGRKYYGSFSL